MRFLVLTIIIQLLYLTARRILSKDCNQPLGMESEAIGNEQISASSTWNKEHKPWQARLNFKESSEVDGDNNKIVLQAGAWAAKKKNEDQWLQVDLRCETEVTGIATQGRNSVLYDRWVKTYKLNYSVDGKSFHTYKEGNDNSVKIFEGNNDKNTVQNHSLNVPIRARYVRILPVDLHAEVSLRMELYGCQDHCRDQHYLPLKEGAALNSHLIRRFDAKDESFCKVQCYMESDCVSYNLKGKSGGSYTCELNNSTHVEHPKDLQNNYTQVDYIYRPSKNLCGENPCYNNGKCQSGFTCKGYRCICAGGFVGENCKDVPNECRIYMNVTRTECQHPSGKVTKRCKGTLFGWFRFLGQEGPNWNYHCPQSNNCDGLLQGDIKDSRPTPDDGPVTRKVCLGVSSCKEITVRNCSDFFVYYLTGVTKTNTSLHFQIH